jgi:hypothetical protein
MLHVASKRLALIVRRNRMATARASADRADAASDPSIARGITTSIAATAATVMNVIRIRMAPPLLAESGRAEVAATL